MTTTTTMNNNTAATTTPTTQPRTSLMTTTTSATSAATTMTTMKRIIHHNRSIVQRRRLELAKQQQQQMAKARKKKKKCAPSAVKIDDFRQRRDKNTRAIFQRFHHPWHHQHHSHGGPGGGELPFWLGHEDPSHIQSIVSSYAKFLAIGMFDDDVAQQQRSFMNQQQQQKLQQQHKTRSNSSSCAARPREFIGKLSRYPSQEDLSSLDGDYQQPSHTLEEEEQRSHFITFDEIHVFRRENFVPGKPMPYSRRLHLQTVWNRTDGIPIQHELVQDVRQFRLETCEQDKSFNLYSLPVFDSLTRNDYKFLTVVSSADMDEGIDQGNGSKLLFHSSNDDDDDEDDDDDDENYGESSSSCSSSFITHSDLYSQCIHKNGILLRKIGMQHLKQMATDPTAVLDGRELGDHIQQLWEEIQEEEEEQYKQLNEPLYSYYYDDEEYEDDEYESEADDSWLSESDSDDSDYEDDSECDDSEYESNSEYEDEEDSEYEDEEEDEEDELMGTSPDDYLKSLLSPCSASGPLLLNNFSFDHQFKEDFDRICNKDAKNSDWDEHDWTEDSDDLDMGIVSVDFSKSTMTSTTAATPVGRFSVKI